MGINKTQETPQAPARKRGRPAGSKNKKKPTRKYSEKKKVTGKPKDPAAKTATPKRKPGRPKKNTENPENVKFSFQPMENQPETVDTEPVKTKGLVEVKQKHDDKRTDQQRTKDAKERFIKLFYENMGIVTATCEAAGIGRATYYLWIREDKEFKKRCQESTEICLDYAEHQLFKAMTMLNTAAIIFYLKTRGRKRGYIEHMPKQDKEKPDNTGLLLEAMKKQLED